MKKIPLIDFYELQGIQHFTDETTEMSTFEGYAQEADSKNQNERIYPKSALTKALDAVQPRIKKNKIVSYVNHPKWMDGPDLEKIGAIITEAYLDEKGVVRVKGRFTSTDAAKNLKALLKDGFCVGISARGYGSCTYDEKRKAYIIGDDYVVDGWDFVSDPAVKKAAVTAYENYIRDSYEHQNNNEEDSKMEKFNNLSELKVAYPAFIAEALKPIEDQNGKLVADNVNLSKELKGVTDSLEATKKELADAKAKLADAEAVAAKAKYDAEVAAMLKDNKFSAYITVPAFIKDINDAKVYIDGETAKYEKFLAESKTELPKADVPKVPGKTEDKNTPKAYDIMDEYIKMATV